MKWWGRVGTITALLGLAACGTEVAGSTTAGGGPTSAVPRPVPTPLTVHTPPAPPPSPKVCPKSGAQLTVGPVDAALGHRAVVIKLTNCRRTPIVLDGYPEVAVLDARRHTMNVTVAHGMSYMANDPGPTRISVGTGDSALAVVSWSNTTEVAKDKASGTYLSVARRRGADHTVLPVDTDLGTTATITVTAWCRKYPT